MSTLAAVNALILRGWDWWTREMKAVARDVAHRLRLPWDEMLTIRPIAEGFEIVGENSSGMQRLEPFSAPENRGARKQQGILLVPASHLIERTLCFPAVARRDLGSAIPLMLAETSPVPLERIHVARGQSSARNGLIEVPVALVHRQTVEDWIDRLNGHGIRIRRVESPLGWTFLEATESLTRLETTERRVRRGLLAAGLAAIMLVGWMYQQRLDKELALTGISYRNIAPLATEDSDLRTRWNRDLRILSTLNQVDHGPAFLSLLDSLGSAIPKTMWVQQLYFDGHAIHLTVMVPVHADIGATLLELPQVQSVTENERVALEKDADEERVELLVSLKDYKAS